MQHALEGGELQPFAVALRGSGSDGEPSTSSSKRKGRGDEEAEGPKRQGKRRKASHRRIPMSAMLRRVAAEGANDDVEAAAAAAVSGRLPTRLPANGTPSPTAAATPANTEAGAIVLVGGQQQQQQGGDEEHHEGGEDGAAQDTLSDISDSEVDVYIAEAEEVRGRACGMCQQGWGAPPAPATSRTPAAACRRGAKRRFGT